MVQQRMQRGYPSVTSSSAKIQFITHNLQLNLLQILQSKCTQNYQRGKKIPAKLREQIEYLLQIENSLAYRPENSR